MKDPARPVTAWLPEVDASYRDAADADASVEEMVERLRQGLSAMVALDEYGRPVPWRSVVRLALGPTLDRLRDAETSLALLEQAITVAERKGGSERVIDLDAAPTAQPAETTRTTRARTKGSS